MILAMKESKEVVEKQKKWPKRIGHPRKIFDDRDRVSMSQTAWKFDCNKSLINYTLKRSLQLSPGRKKLYRSEMKLSVNV